MKKEEKTLLIKAKKIQEANHINKGLKDLDEGKIIQGQALIDELKEKYNI